NNFKNRVRRKRHPSISFDQAGPTNALEPLEDEQQSPEMLVEARETGEMLGQLVAALPQRYRAAVILRHIEGLGYAELAAILHQPVGTIKANVHRGTALLRKAISQQIYEKEVV
ncbi:MAG: sigma-70 family RNA polymerase sigma factor, partial [Ktedonobacteraceae bacterium]|nr:sigma-70 family RNA polymerase sigma factor [Ktedonobacteraceae bacterium]